MGKIKSRVGLEKDEVFSYCLPLPFRKTKSMIKEQPCDHAFFL